jgi:DNA-binding CsgD family transcriptional regulator
MVNPLARAMLDAMTGPAFVLSVTGVVVATNAPGKALLDDKGRRVRAELGRAAKAHGNLRWAAVTVSATAIEPGRLLITLRGGVSASMSAAIERAARRWDLTARERDVLRELVSGLANKSIATCLGISPRTVERHVSALLEKAGVESRAVLVARARGER